MRNSRYVLRKGPLIIYGDENNLVKRTARNLPGVDTCNVHRLNLLQLAPGGHLGRFIIWTKDAFKALNQIFGNYRAKGVEKGGYVLNRNLLTVADLSRLINSDQVQSKVRAIRKSVVAHDRQKRNPLQNRALMHKLNPHDAIRRAADLKLQKERNSKRAETLKAKRSPSAKKAKKDRKAKHTALANGLVKSYQDALNVLQKEEDLGIMNKKEAEESGSDDE